MQPLLKMSDEDSILTCSKSVRFCVEGTSLVTDLRFHTASVESRPFQNIAVWERAHS